MCGRQVWDGLGKPGFDWVDVQELQVVVGLCEKRVFPTVVGNEVCTSCGAKTRLLGMNAGDVCSI